MASLWDALDNAAQEPGNLFHLRVVTGSFRRCEPLLPKELLDSTNKEYTIMHAIARFLSKPIANQIWFSFGLVTIFSASADLLF